METFLGFIRHSEKRWRHAIADEDADECMAASCIQIRKLTFRAPEEIKQKILDSFADVWDIRGNCSVENQGEGELTVKAVANCFKDLLSALVKDDNTRTTSTISIDASREEIEVQDEELSDVRLAVRRLWDIDSNRLVHGEDFKLSLQGAKKPYEPGDRAADSLLGWVREDLFESRPTFGLLKALLDNYERRTGVMEVTTEEEHMETWDFLRGIKETAPIKYLTAYLLKLGTLEDIDDEEDVISELFEVWFSLYRRERGLDSSAFEHVFVGEEREPSSVTSGFHNWIQFYLEEQKGSVDYLGMILPRRSGGYPDSSVSSNYLLTVQFTWEDDLKNVGSMFIGTSPEFEIAVYSLLFFLRKQKTSVPLPLGVNGEEIDVEFTVHQFSSKRHGQRLGTAFPSLTN